VVASDLEYLRGRSTTVVPANVPPFQDAVRLFGSNDRVNDFNLTRLKELKEPVARVNAVSRGTNAAMLHAASFEGIEQVAFFTIGAKVLLTHHVWVGHGPANGSEGIIRDIRYVEGMRPPGAQPACMLVDFPAYTGPPFFRYARTEVPLCVMTAQCSYGGHV